MKRVLITGAASGLGAELARRFASAGYAVCVADLQQEAGEKVVTELRGMGSDSFFFSLNVTSDEQWQALVNEVQQRWGGIDCIINNAGVAASGYIEDLPMKDWQWVMDINLMGVVRGCYYFTPILRKTKGRIINIASMAGLVHAPTMSAYNASKAAVVALSETLKVELIEDGVCVSVVCPAFFRTNIGSTMRSTIPNIQNSLNKLMDGSGITAADVADQVYRDSHAGKFFILTHAKERWFWRIKRFSPDYFHTLLRKQWQRNLKIKATDALKKQGAA